MGKQLEEDDIRMFLADRCEAAKSQLVIAKALGFSPQYIGDVIKRGKSISAELAKRMGYRRVVRFEEITDNDNA